MNANVINKGDYGYTHKNILRSLMRFECQFVLIRYVYCQVDCHSLYRQVDCNETVGKFNIMRTIDIYYVPTSSVSNLYILSIEVDY